MHFFWLFVGMFFAAVLLAGCQLTEPQSEEVRALSRSGLDALADVVFQPD